MNSWIQCMLLKRLLLSLLLFVCLLVFQIQCYAQEQPPRPIDARITSIITLQQLNFGSVIPTGADGTVTVPSSFGPRTYLGNVLLLNSFFSPALFEVEAIPGTVIAISYNTPLALTSSNGRSVMLVDAESSEGSPFVTRTDRTYVYIGGTIHVQTILDNPSGSYFGLLYVTFTQIHQ
jgi:hypothetical protein